MKKINNKGITLVALVITIVITLILASITVSSLSGRDNIIEGAKNEKNYREGIIVNTERQINQLYDELQEMN